jgi:hypothetical protein
MTVAGSNLRGSGLATSNLTGGFLNSKQWSMTR